MAESSPWRAESTADTRSEDRILTDDEVDSPPLITAARATLVSCRSKRKVKMRLCTGQEVKYKRVSLSE
jgi:hypothetical protein